MLIVKIRNTKNIIRTIGFLATLLSEILVDPRDAILGFQRTDIPKIPSTETTVQACSSTLFENFEDDVQVVCDMRKLLDEGGGPDDWWW